MIGAVTRVAAIAKQLVQLGRELDRWLTRVGGRCCVGRSQLLLDRARRRSR
jgi:hypothetical protein